MNILWRLRLDDHHRLRRRLSRLRGTGRRRGRRCALADEKSRAKARHESDDEHAGAKSVAAGEGGRLLEEPIAVARRSIGATGRIEIL